MGILQDFRQKDMIEQIMALEEIKETRQVGALETLFDLYLNPLGDQAVEEMVYHTLYALLEGQEERIIAGFSHAAQPVRIMCVRRAAAGTSDAVIPSLVALLRASDDVELLSEILRALASRNDPALCEVFLPFLQHENDTLVGWAMHALVILKDETARDAFLDLINGSETMNGARESGCELRIAMAVEHLEHFVDEKTIAFLVSHIHHRNPALRAVVNVTLGRMGEAVLGRLQERLANGDRDEKIMAANIIGMLGEKKGADILIQQIEGAKETNLKFAIYEALGCIPSLRSVIGLADGLGEEDELVLMAVLTALDNLCNPGVVKLVSQALDKGDAQSKRLLQAMVAGRSQRLFAALYVDSRHVEAMLTAIQDSADQEAVGVFQKALQGLGTEQAKADAQRLTVLSPPFDLHRKRLLVADDSKAMLSFYKAVTADLGMELVTVEDGKQAYHYLLMDSLFDLIITDLNMPNMDGIELTRLLRKLQACAETPILMATTESESSQSALARQAGVTDFISKPFSKEALKTKITQMFG